MPFVKKKVSGELASNLCEIMRGLKGQFKLLHFQC